MYSRSFIERNDSIPLILSAGQQVFKKILKYF